MSDILPKRSRRQKMSLLEDQTSWYEQEQTCLLRLVYQSDMFRESYRLHAARKEIYELSWRTRPGNKAIFTQVSNALLSWNPWLPHDRDNKCHRLSNKKIGKGPRPGYLQRNTHLAMVFTLSSYTGYRSSGLPTRVQTWSLRIWDVRRFVPPQ